MRRVRRLVVIMLSVGVVLASLAALAKPLLLRVVTRQLAQVFIDSRVQVSRCGIHPFSRISFQGVSVQRDGAYRLSLDDVSIEYSLSSLLRFGLKAVVIEGVRLRLHTPAQPLARAVDYLALKKGGGLKIGRLLAKAVELDIKASDIEGVIGADIVVDPLTQRFLSGKISLPRGRSQGIELTGAQAEITGSNTVAISVAEAGYNKIRVKDIAAAVRLDNPQVFVDSLSARVFGGTIQGSGRVGLSLPSEYAAALSAEGIDLAVLQQELDLGEKVDMTGRVNGELALGGKSRFFKLLNGVFSVVEPGGALVIKDQNFFEYIANSTHQPLEVIIAGFQNYRYTLGNAKLYLQNDQLMLDIVLDGLQGKFSLNIALHDFQK